MKRYDIINSLVNKYSYQSYLEIGTLHGGCITNLKKLPLMESVDPHKQYKDLTHEMTSDEYFLQNTKTFDMIFIDGLHIEEQCSKDLKNALKILNPKGTIVVHDSLPHCEEFIQPCYSGTVFRSIIDLRCNRSDVTVRVVDTDCGCSIIQFGQQKLYDEVSFDVAKTYAYYEKHKKELMNLITTDEFIQQYS